MTERIYTRGSEGQLDPLEEEPFSTEEELQALIAQHPELLDGEQIRPGGPRRWMLITREKGLAETPDTGARWAEAWSVSHHDASQHIDLLANRLAKVFSELKSL